MCIYWTLKFSSLTSKNLPGIHNSFFFSKRAIHHKFFLFHIIYERIKEILLIPVPRLRR